MKYIMIYLISYVEKDYLNEDFLKYFVKMFRILIYIIV